MKLKLQQMRTARIRIKYSTFSPEELEEIDKLTEFIKTDNFTEKCYCILNDISNTVRCAKCNKSPSFLRISSGYRTFCSTICKNKNISNDTLQKISNTLKEYHVNLSNSERRKQQNKRLHTMVDRKIISSPHLRKSLYLYGRSVWRYTNQNNLHKLENYNLRGRIEVKNSFQLDHKFSISEGFRQNIPTYIIGSIHNLKMIPSRINSSKKHRCSIAKEKLFREYFKNI